MSGAIGEAIFIPRLQKSVHLDSVRRAIEDSVQTLGYDKIRPEQFNAVFNFVKGNDVFISLPTGGEKACVLLVCLWCTTGCEKFLPNPLLWSFLL